MPSRGSPELVLTTAPFLPLRLSSPECVPLPANGGAARAMAVPVFTAVLVFTEVPATPAAAADAEGAVVAVAAAASLASSSSSKVLVLSSRRTKHHSSVASCPTVAACRT